MATFIWTVTLLHAFTGVMNLIVAVRSNDIKTRGLAVFTIVLQGGLSIWGFWLLLS